MFPKAPMVRVRRMFRKDRKVPLRQPVPCLGERLQIGRWTEYDNE